jgi:hypothetical protein
MKERSISAVVGFYLARYDHNRNGRIDLPRNQTSKMQIQVDGVSYQKDTSKVYAPDELLTSNGWSYEKEQAFVRASDTDGDGAATTAEMTGLVKTFDRNSDGRLDERGFWAQLFGLFGFGKKGEYEVFNDDFGGP